jgi:hypothetical protein
MTAIPARRDQVSTAIAAGAIAAITLHVLLRFTTPNAPTSLIPLYAVLIFGGIPLTYGLARTAL